MVFFFVLQTENTALLQLAKTKHEGCVKNFVTVLAAVIFSPFREYLHYCKRNNVEHGKPNYFYFRIKIIKISLDCSANCFLNSDFICLEVPGHYSKLFHELLL